MNIGIFDTEHFETAYAVARLFQSSENSIILFTDEHCKKRLLEYPGIDENAYTWFIKQDAESHPEFILRYSDFLKRSNIDLLFLSTISNNHLLHALVLRRNPKIRTVLTVHDINDFMDRSISMTMKKSVKNFSKQILLKQVRELNVLSDTMIALLRQKTAGKYTIHNIPGGILESTPARMSIEGRIKLVVPGTLEKIRKDYFQAIEFIINADAQKVPIDMVFLGRPIGKYGAGILAAVSEIKLKHCSITTFPSEVSQLIFEQELSSAHFIFVPCVKISERENSPPEFYGESKITGGMFDAIRHARPMIVPSFMQMPQNMEKACLRYREADDLLKSLHDLLRMRTDYLKWQENALNASQHYTLENIRASRPTLFDYSR